MPFAVDETELRNRIKNKMIRPTTIPQTLEDLVIEQAICREALRLSFEQHKVARRGTQGPAAGARHLRRARRSPRSGATLVDLMDLGLLVGSGGVLSHAPRRAQAMLMMIDAFLPEGVTELAVDSIFMMPQLGVLSTVHEEAATQVFERDCLILLGACVAPVGSRASRAQPCVTRRGARRSGAPDRAARAVRRARALPLPDGAGRVRLVATPERGFDLGAGTRQAASNARCAAASSGVVVDARGRRPFELPADADAAHRGAARVEPRARRSTRGRCDVAHSYTPGLRVTEHAVVRRERRLPLQGEVLVALGDARRARHGRRALRSCPATSRP